MEIEQVKQEQEQKRVVGVKRRSQESSGNNIASLFPHDLILNILGRLPPKSLIRFKSLSRSWRRVISNPLFHFCHHNSCSNRKLKLLFRLTGLRFYREGILSYEFVWIDSPGIVPTGPVSTFKVKVIDPIRLILPTSFGVFCFATHTLIYLCNPSLGQILPLLPQDPLPGCQGTVMAGFGFGFLLSKMAFKVVKLTERSARPGMMFFSVYTVGLENQNSNDDRSWKVLDLTAPYLVQPFGVPATVKQHVYWKINRRRIRNRTSDQSAVLAFSLEHETFKVIGWPVECEDIDENCVQLVELKENLVMVEIFRAPDSVAMMMRMWELTDMSNSIWSSSVIDLGGIDKGLNVVEVKGMNPEVLVLSTDSNVLVYYHMTKKTFRHVVLSLPPFSDFIVCGESIASLPRPI